MTDLEQEKVFELMCTKGFKLGAVLFKQNELDIDEFTDYVFHRAPWECEMSINNHSVYYILYVLNDQIDISYYSSFKQIQFWAEDYDIKDRTMTLDDNYKPSENYSPDNLYNSLKIHLQKRIDELNML